MREENRIEEDFEQMPIQQVGNMPYYQPTIMPADKSELYDKIKPEEVVETIKFMLMGYEFDTKKNEWVLRKEFEQNSLNEVGAFKIATMLLSVSNKGIPITRTTDEEIRRRIRYLITQIMLDCLSNWKEYGIKTSSTFGNIKEISMGIALFTLKQSEGGGGRAFIQGVSQESKIIQETSSKNKGFLSGFLKR